MFCSKNKAQEEGRRRAILRKNILDYSRLRGTIKSIQNPELLTASWRYQTNPTNHYHYSALLKFGAENLPALRAPSLSRGIVLLPLAIVFESLRDECFFDLYTNVFINKHDLSKFIGQI